MTKKEKAPILDYYPTVRHLSAATWNLQQNCWTVSWRTLPIFKRVSVSDTTSKRNEKLHQRQKLQAFYYNKTAGPTLQPFQPGQPINIYDHHTQTWERGTVIRPAKEPRPQWPNRRCQPRPEVKDNSIKETPPTTPETAASQDSLATPPQDGQAYTTRSGRISKPPDWLDT